MPTKAPGWVWIVPQSQTAAKGTIGVQISIHVDTGSSMIAAYGIDVTFDSNLMESFSASAESTGFMAFANLMSPGVYRVSGFDATGKGPSSDLALFKITCNASSSNTGTSDIGIIIMSLVDPGTATIGSPTGVGGTITVN